MPRLLHCEEALRFDSSVGGGRTTTFSALRKVCSSRDSSNAAPNRPSLGPPGKRSQHPRGLAGAIALLESGGDGSGSTTYLHGVAVIAIRASGDLAGDTHSSPPR